MKFIAHRGLTNNDITENTISAFDNAFNNAFDGIELDVRRTKNKKIVIIHDSFLSRVSDGVGLVSNHTDAELLKYNFGKKHKTERIPHLKDVITRYHNKLIMIEIKENIKIEELELELNKDNNYYLSSFNFDYIKNIPKSKSYKKGVINYVLNTNIDLSKIDFIMILDLLINDKLYEFYRQKNIEVIIYGVGRKINLNLSKEIRDKIKYII